MLLKRILRGLMTYQQVTYQQVTYQQATYQQVHISKLHISKLHISKLHISKVFPAADMVRLIYSEIIQRDNIIVV